MATYPVRTPGALGALEDRMARLEQRLRQISSPTAEQYAQAVASLPLVQTTSGGTYGLGLTDQASNVYREWVTMTLEVPQGKSSLDGMVMATASIADASSGGVAFVNMRIRVGYPRGVQYSMVFPSAKQFGSYDSRNALTGAVAISQVGLQPGDLVEVGIQLAASSPSAFPAATGNDLEASAIVSAANLL